MIVSRNEVHGVVRKAALGARLPGGTADDLANAASWMEAYGLSALPLAIDVIATGTAGNINIATFFDRIAADEKSVQVDGANLLVVGFAADAAGAYGMGFAIEWAGCRAQVGADGFVLSGDNANGRATISACDPPAATTKSAEISVRQDDWARANQLAAAYYVPATEASRLGGAGAGVNDND